jgi:hypothetical protein
MQRSKQMSVGRNLQEMENVVTKGAKPAEPMPKLTTGIPDGQTGNWEDLGGPTPENYRPDDDSSKLKEPSATLSQVRNVVNKGAKSAEPMQHLRKDSVKEEEELSDEDLIVEEEETEEDDKKGKKNKSKKNIGKDDDDKDDDDDDEDEDVKEDFDIEEDVNALLAGEDLSEEFQEKAKIIFEAAIRSKVSSIREELEQKFQHEYEQSLIEEISLIKEQLTDRVDAYLEYVSDEWMHENALSVEHGLRTEMSESFLSGMRQLFEDHYVTIPEDRYDVIESMVDKLDEMEGKLNEQIEKNVALNRRLAESVADVIFADVTEGLALSQKDKLASLVENVEFDSEENYREKLLTLRNSYFSSNVTNTQRDVTENIAEDADYSEQTNHVSPVMESYLSVLSRVSKK